MASRRERARRAGLLLLGLVVGLGVTVLGLLTYVNHVRHARTEALVSARLGLPREAFSLERITVDGHVVGSLSRVALLARGGDTVATAPEVTFSFDARSLAGKGPIEFDAMEVRRPFIRLAQARDGTWNFSRIWRVQAGGKDVKLAAANNAADSRPYVVRNARIVDGRASVAMLAGPVPDSGTALFAAEGGAPRVRVGRQVMTVRHVTGINGTLSSIRFGGADGWKIDVGSLTAKADHPDLHVAQLAGTVGSRDGERIDFDIRTLRTDHSAFDGKGSIRLADAGLGMDFRIRAHPLDFRDLRGLGYKIPASGIARFALDVRSGARGAVTYRVTDATVAALDSRASGHATIVTSPGAAPAFSDTRLALEPLRISTLEELGLVKPTGLAGEVRGTIASVDEVRAGRGSLRLDLEGTIAPKGGGETSTIAANGLVALGANGGAPRFDGLRIDARPLYLATLRPFAPAQANMLRGVLRGGATLTGTTESFRIEAGNLAYQVGTAPSTRLSGLSGRVTMGTTPTFDLTARAEPLALATLTELFPALPFRTAVLNGPISIAGSTQRMRVTANLQGDPGGIDLRATVALGAVPRFDVDANLSAFRAGAVLAGGVPLDGPLSGHVAASGTTEDFRFDTNLTQGAGRLQLAGTVRRPGGTAPQVDVSGRVDNFRVGLLVGKPDLLGGPVSGPIAVSGGGRRPYRFDVGLAGAVGMLDLHGWYAAGTVPSYAVAGRVAGLDLHGLPGFATVPVTNLTATVDIAGSGTTPETFNGRIAFDASPGSTVGGVPLEAATARIVAANGVLRVDTFTVALRGARAEASGTLGLTRDDPVGLRFSLTAPNLAAVTGLFPTAVVGGTLPQVSGAVSARGTVTGSLRNLAVNATASGSNVQYGTNRAGSFSLIASGTLGAAGWTGHAAVKATDVAAAGQTLT
ncbi:MAG TPA: hypothetical protein VFE05_16420, partial [Longimicrobiaceae bacterium]|nr:hypothetical protein [Longimicrobiaceae bacterium]